MAYDNTNVALFLASFGSNNINTTGNVRANYFTGNGSLLKSIQGANVVGQVAFANVANRVAVANVTGLGNVATINTDGSSTNVLYGNGVFAPVTGATDANITALLANFGSNTISTSGNVTVGNIIGNGQALTSLTGANVTGQVSFANVANRVAVANVQGIGNIATINRDGNGSNILYGNGVFGPLPGTAFYGNSNVVSLLSSYGSNTITTTGNISAGNFSGNFVGNGTGLTNIPGTNVTGQVSYSAVANSISVANVQGIGNIATVNRDGNVSNVLSGAGTWVPLPNGGGNGSNYSDSNVVTLLSNFGSNNISTTGTVQAGNIIGNGSGLTSVTGANVTGQVPYANIANRINVSNVVGIGNLATLNRDGNASNVLYGNGVFSAAPSGGTGYNNSSAAAYLASFGSNTITTTGNISAGNISGNISGSGSKLSNLTGANVTGQVAYAAVANSISVANVQGIGNLATLNRDGNASNVLYGNGVFSTAPSGGTGYNNSSAAAYLASFGSNTITTTGNISAGNVSGKFIGNGAGLTNLTGANVTGQVAYAAVANSISVANVQGIGNLATLNRDGNASNVLYGNGVFSAAPSGGTGYNNSSAASYLASFGSNTITTTGNISAGNISGNISGSGAGLTNLTGANVTGQVSFANVANSVNVSNVVGIGNISTINRDGNASNVLYGNGVFASGSQYSNAKVASFLASFGSNTITTTGNISVGNVIATNIGNIARLNIDGNYQTVLYGNGVFGPVPNGTANYSNTNVVNLLYNFGSNRISTTGNISAGNLIGNGQSIFGIRGSNISGAVQYATIANSVALSNVQGIGNIASLNLTGSSSRVLYGNGVFANISANSTPGGNNSQLQFNSNGVLGGIPEVTYDDANNILNLGSLTNLSIEGGQDGYVLQTDGEGGLGWTQQTGGGGTGISYVVQDITVASIANVTTVSNHSFVDGSSLVFTNADGTSSDWSNINNKTYYAGNVTANTFEVYTDFDLTTGLDTSAFNGSYTANSANVLYVVAAQPAGVNQSIQYNNAGVMGGSSKFKIDVANSNMYVTGNIISTTSLRVTGYGGNITGALDITASGNVVATNIIANYAVSETLTSNLISTDQIYFSNTGAMVISSSNDLNFNAEGAINYNNPIGLSLKTNDDLANLSALEGSLVYNVDVSGLAYFNGSTWVNIAGGNTPSANDIYANSVTTRSLYFSGTGPVIVNSGSDLSFEPAGQVIFGSLATMVSMTKAELANAAPSIGSFAYCTDANGGACPAYYNGTSWLKFSDNGSV